MAAHRQFSMEIEKHAFKCFQRVPVFNKLTFDNSMNRSWKLPRFFERAPMSDSYSDDLSNDSRMPISSTCLRPSRHRALTSDLLMDVLQFCCAYFFDFQMFVVFAWLTEWLLLETFWCFCLSVLLCWGSFFTVFCDDLCVFLRILVSFWYPWGSFGDPEPSQGTPEGANSKK